jgi:hypothetical protein
LNAWLKELSEPAPSLQQRLGFHGACLISWVIWAVRHFPELLWADYNAGTNAVFGIGCFTVMVIAMAYIMGYPPNTA